MRAVLDLTNGALKLGRNGVFTQPRPVADLAHFKKHYPEHCCFQVLEAGDPDRTITTVVTSR